MASVDTYREQFPVTEEYAYFRHPAVGALPRATREALRDLTDDMTRNGCLNEGDWRKRVRRTRRRAAELVSADPDRIGFVSSTSHGLSWLAESMPLEAGETVLVPDCEFPANRFPWQNLRRRGISFETIPTDGGVVRVQDVEDCLGADVRALSLSSVQFSNGFRADLETVGELCREEDVFFVVDAIQSLGWDDLSVEELPVDALVADGHKWLCGPEGAGFLYLRESFQERLEPALVGWHSVQSRYEFENPRFDLRTDAGVVELGSQNTIGLVGLGTSLEVLLDVGLDTIRNRVRDLRRTLTSLLTERGFDCRHTDWEPRHRSPIVALDHPDLPGEGVVEECADRGVQLTRRGSRLRVGVHYYNNEDDLERLVQALESIVE